MYPVGGVLEVRGQGLNCHWSLIRADKAIRGLSSEVKRKVWGADLENILIEMLEPLGFLYVSAVISKVTFIWSLS